MVKNAPILPADTWPNNLAEYRKLQASKRAATGEIRKQKALIRRPRVDETIRMRVAEEIATLCGESLEEYLAAKAAR
jgi:hypothetical protein